MKCCVCGASDSCCKSGSAAPFFESDNNTCPTGCVDGAGNPADCEQRNSAGCEPRGPAGSSRAASPLLAKLKPTGPPKTLCRDLPKRQPRSTKVLETPDALRMKLAIESEVISEHVQGSGDGEGEGEYEGEGSGEGEGEGDYKASHRHSAPANGA